MYDLIIIGSGPAGLTASIYASRYKLSNLVIGKISGGTITMAHKVENFPGFLGTGMELGQKMMEQAKGLGAEIVGEEVVKIGTIGENAEIGGFSNVHLPGAPQVQPHLEGGNGLAESRISSRRFRVITKTNKEFEARTLIIATGTERRKLDVPGEKEYLGRGVSYCTTCDAAFFKDKTVVLVGGSNASCSGAIHLAQFARKIYLIYRKDELRAEPVWVEEVKQNPRIEIVYKTNITKIIGGKEGLGGIGGQERVTGVELDNPYGGEKILKTDGVFIEVGGVPIDSFLASLGVELDENSYIKVNERMETNLPGLFAAGDVTTHSLVMSQAIVACADGAIAAGGIYQYLKGQKAPKINGNGR